MFFTDSFGRSKEVGHHDRRGDGEPQSHRKRTNAFCHTLAYANRPLEKSLGWQFAMIAECDGDFDLRADNEA